MGDIDAAKDFIDPNAFEQILEMDDDPDDRDFSKTIVFEFFQQAETTFQDMKGGIEKKDLVQLSSLGHFLKGSSATLGLIKIKDACEAIQHLGAGLSEDGTKKINDPEKCLSEIKVKLDGMMNDYKTVESFLNKFYDVPQ